MKITKKVILEITQAEYEVQLGFADKWAPAIKPSLGPPASSDALATLGAHLKKEGFFLPKSYGQFLSVCNGIKNFTSNVDLLSIQELNKTPHPSTKRGYPSYARFIIGIANSLEFIAFDPASAGDEEMEVVWINDIGEERRYLNFSIFLNERLKNTVRAAKVQKVKSSHNRKKRSK